MNYTLLKQPDKLAFRIRCLYSKLALSIFTLILFTEIAAQAQSITLTGKVVDSENGQSIPGVTVMIAGTGKGTITDLNGSYSIAIDNAATTNLVFKFVGYIDQTIAVGSKTRVDVKLEVENKNLDEVVVVGYGTQKKESVVGAISVVDNKELMKIPSANLSQSITGKVAGVITIQNGGQPGYDEADIYIRGQATFSGNSAPLILVDGVERSFSRIDPNDVDQISFLKDAASTAVYGVRGANGVLLITTKRGKIGKPKVSFSANSGFQTPTRLPKYLNSYESVKLLEEALKNDGLPSMYSAADIAAYKRSVSGQLPTDSTYLYPNVDWYKEALRDYAPEYQTSINVSGGTKRMRYFVSGTYFDQQGLYKEADTYEYGNSSNVRFRRYSFRANMDFDLTKDFTASINFGTRFEMRNGPSAATDDAAMAQEDVFYQLNRTPGWIFPVQWADGTYGGNAFANRNIIARLQHGGFNITNGVVNENSFILNHKLDFITQGLSIRGMFSYDNQFNYTRAFSRNFATYEHVRATGQIVKYNEDTPLNLTGEAQNNTKHINSELSINYGRTFNNVHEVSGLVLYTQNNYSYMNVVPFLNQGLVGRATYAFDKRYFVEYNFGYNGSENFAKGKRFGYFPSYALGWNISNEQFMKDNAAIVEHLKLRGSYGEVGNDKTNKNVLYSDRYLYTSTWVQSGGYWLGDNYMQGIYEGRWPNSEVTWERAKKYNLGFESSLRGQMLGVNADVFFEKRDNILANRQTIPSVIAVELPKENVGRTENKGYELEVFHRNRVTSDFSYYLNAKYMFARNKIIFRDEPVNLPTYQKTEGSQIGRYTGLVSEGYFRNQADIDANPLQTFGPVSPGDLKYRDMNGDGIVDARDMAYIGDPSIPEQTFSLNTEITYKNWEFSVLLQGVSSVSKTYNSEAIWEFLNGGKVMDHHLNRWNPAASQAENEANASYPLLHYSKGQNNHQSSTYWLRSGEFLRLKNVEMAYTLPKSFVSKMKIESIRFYINASNLYTWDHIKIRDPENTGDGKVYPIMAFYNMGVNVQF